MNRRTFLKAIAVTTLLPVLPLYAKKQQWIKLTDRLPEVGQKIILTNNIGRPNFEGGVIAESSHLEKRKDDEFHVTISMTKLDFVQCFKNPRQDIMINYVYSDEGEEAFRSRTWLETTVKKEYSYHKEIRCNHTYALYPRKEMVWLPVNGKYPINIPPLPKCVAPWMSFSWITPGQDNLIKVKKETGEIKKGRFVEVINYKTNEKSRVLVHDPDPFYTEIKKHWHWRHVS